MKIYKTQVVSTTDLTQTGRFTARLDGLGEIDVIYTTPYLGTNAEGGFFAIPEEGAEVLVTQPDNSPEYFYLNSIAGIPNLLPNTQQVEVPPEDILPERGIYAHRGVPMRFGFYTPKGNKVLLSDGYNSQSIDIKVGLQSHTGKKVLLHDSPDIDSILIWNEHRDGIKITTDATEVSPARAIEVESVGPQSYICKESQMDILVYDGRELNIKNQSTGVNRPGGSAAAKYGNINVESEHRDINMTVRSADGRIFIDALGEAGLIQLDSTGKVIVNSTANNVEVNAGLSILLKAVGNISLEAGGLITMKSGAGINLDTTGLATILGALGVNADGATIHLNEGLSPPVAPIEIIKLDNYYGD